jgi:hypothetical protein
MEKQRWEDVGRVREHFKVTMWKTHHDLLEVAMSKKCSRRCGRRHIVKTRKTLHVGSTFGRSTAPHKTTTTTLHYIPLHPAVVGEVTTATTPKSTTPTYSNHLSVHQQIRSPTHASQKFTLPMGSYLRNFRHRLVRSYWYTYDFMLFHTVPFPPRKQSPHVWESEGPSKSYFVEFGLCLKLIGTQSFCLRSFNGSLVERPWKSKRFLGKHYFSYVVFFRFPNTRFIFVLVWFLSGDILLSSGKRA